MNLILRINHLDDNFFYKKKALSTNMIITDIPNFFTKESIMQVVVGHSVGQAKNGKKKGPRFYI
jgi:hypothetical protein